MDEQQPLCPTQIPGWGDKAQVYSEQQENLFHTGRKICTDPPVPGTVGLLPASAGRTGADILVGWQEHWALPRAQKIEWLWRKDTVTQQIPEMGSMQTAGMVNLYSFMSSRKTGYQGEFSSDMAAIQVIVMPTFPYKLLCFVHNFFF